MNSHLLYTCSEFDQNADARGVHPISGVDGEIIMQLIDMSTQLGLAPLLEVLEQWKNVDDNKILASLTEMNQALENGEELMPKSKDKNERPVTDYVEIQDENIRVKDIFRIKKHENYVEGRWMYAIWINPVGEADKISGSLVVDAIFYYGTEMERDTALEELKQKMVKNKKCKFI